MVSHSGFRAHSPCKDEVRYSRDDRNMIGNNANDGIYSLGRDHFAAMQAGDHININNQTIYLCGQHWHGFALHSLPVQRQKAYEE